MSRNTSSAATPESPLERLALIHLNEAYNYFSCALTEADERLGQIWERGLEMEITHFHLCNELLKKFEKRDMLEIMKTDAIAPIIMFEQNTAYINQVLATQVNLEPLDKDFVAKDALPQDGPPTPIARR